MAYWWVNITLDQQCEIRDNYIWAPLKSKKDNNSRWHWDSIIDVREGDIIIVYRSNLKSISHVGEVLNIARDAVKPDIDKKNPEFDPKGKWINQGRVIDVNFKELKRRVVINKEKRMKIVSLIRSGERSVIVSDLKVFQGYLCKINELIYQYVIN